MKFNFMLLVIFGALLLLAETASAYRHKNNRRMKVRLMVRRGSRLDHLHKKTLNDWRKAYFLHNKKKHDFAVNDILSQMDSFVRPRFG